MQGGTDLAKIMALTTISQIGREARATVPAIAELLRDERSDLSQSSGRWERLGRRPSRPCPFLIKIFNNDALLYKEHVAEAILAIDLGTATSLGIR